METFQAEYANGLANHRRFALFRYKDLTAGWFIRQEEVQNVICGVCAGRDFTVERPLETEVYQNHAWTIGECKHCGFRFRMIVHG